MALIHWNEETQEAYRLLCKAAKLDRCAIQELTVTFQKSALVQYEVKGLVRPEPPTLDMGTQTCP